MRINKKAMMEDFLQLVAWSIVIVIVFFLFSGVQTAKIKSLLDKSKGIESEIDGNYLLVDFLRQKTENPNADNIAELIGLYYETKDDIFFDEVSKEATAFFSKSFLQTGKNSWMLRILDKENGEIERINGLFDLMGVQKETATSSIVLPVSKKNDDYLIIEIDSIKFEDIGGSP